MKMMHFWTVLFGITIVGSTALGATEIIDSFSDGELTSSPAWSGDTGAWTVTNSDVTDSPPADSDTLRLDAPDSGSDIQHVRVQRAGAWGSEQSWGCWIGRRSQAATTANQSIVWLWANEADLEDSGDSNTIDGYRIRFGDNSSDDEIHLERVDNDSATTILIIHRSSYQRVDRHRFSRSSDANEWI